MGRFKGVGVLCNAADIVSVHALCKMSIFLMVAVS